MLYRFVKMEGLGNDFILFDAEDGSGIMSRENIESLCSRSFGIGADGVIFVLPSSEGYDAEMRIFNSDGSEAEMCGNGIRAFTLYLKKHIGLIKDLYRIKTGAGEIKTEILQDDSVRVDMGVPVFDKESIPFRSQDKEIIGSRIEIDDREFFITGVSMGNPHGVIFVQEVSDELVNLWGKRIGTSDFFPEGANIEFVTLLSETEMNMRVFERGAGETLACGTGACAAAAAAIKAGKCSHEVQVHLRGGDLNIEWEGSDNSGIFMTGPANEVFTGEIEIPDSN